MTDADSSLYDDDFYAWTQEQAELLRRGPAAAIASTSTLIAEEIEDLGKSELHTVQSLCEHIIEHLLKLEYSGLAEPAAIGATRSSNGGCSSNESDAQHHRQAGPAGRYRSALRLLRHLERDVPGLMQRVPAECPYSLDQILGSGDEDWFPPRRGSRSRPRAPARRSPSRCGLPAPPSPRGAAGPAGSGREIRG